MWPSRTRCVRAASAARTENDSNVISSVGSGVVVKWSKTQRLSKPRSSALPGELDRACPGGGRIPAVVLVFPALRGHHPDLRPCLPPHGCCVDVSVMVARSRDRRL